jgi:inorganic pyrophosphatase
VVVIPKSHSLQFVIGAVDVVEIGERRANTGEIMKVKPLAVLAMIDEGELDWKVVAISLDDPKAHLVNDIDDVEKHFPVSVVASLRPAQCSSAAALYFE